MENKEIIYTNQKETQAIKKRLYEAAGGICPLLKREIPLDKMVADHQHKLKKEDCSDWNNGGKGLIRGCIEFRANSIEGKIVNAWTRYGLEKEDITLPEFLRNLASYLEEPPAKQLDKCYAYYTETPKRIKTKKSDNNRIKKYYLYMFPRKSKPYVPNTYVTEEYNKLLSDVNSLDNLIKTDKEERKKFKAWQKIQKKE